MDTEIKEKSVWRSKTVWFAIAKAAAGFFTILLAELPHLEAVGWIGIIVAGLDFSLRMVTTDKVT